MTTSTTRAYTQCRCRGIVTVLAVATCFSAAALAEYDAADLNVRASRTTGLASFVTAKDGGPMSVELPPGRTAVKPMDFLEQYGDLFGVAASAEQLVMSKTRTDALGHTHTTFRQVHRGVPVFSGVLKVHQNAAGFVTVANGDFYAITPKLSMDPAIDAETAVLIARTVVLPAGCVVAHSELVIVDPGWYGDAQRGARLAYYIILEDPAAAVREAVFVDAHSRTILDHWSMTDTARFRMVYDAMQTNDVPGTLARSEGDPPVSAPADVNRAYDYAGDIYDYYSRAFGRDSIDDFGLDMILTTNWFCPNANAFWNGNQMIFCEGTVTDDITAHEMTHGVTQYTANLIYQNQPGQLNESYSDVFGELVDLFNGNAAFPGPPSGSPAWPSHPTGPGQDTPNNLRTGCSFGFPPNYPSGVRWLAGEDSFAFGGAIRDMWDPTCMGDPDRANSEIPICYPFDSGGVHMGSGVPNHAFAILTDGKSFNGYTVDGIGPIKSGAVWYRALSTYLTVASDFRDAYAAINQSALDLIGSDPNDPRTGFPSGDVFTTHDAEQVDKALRATEMDTAGICGSGTVLDTNPPSPCSVPSPIFSDGFESGANGWTFSGSGPGADTDWTLVTDLPDGRPGTAWFAPDSNTNCFDDATALFSLFSPSITMPAEVVFPALEFTHYVETEYGWDGGNLRIKVNGGGWQPIPLGAFSYNPYNVLPLLGPPDNSNALAGQAAFSGMGGEWGTSRVDLGAFVSGGETIQVRFDLGKDFCVGVTGWYVDDVNVSDCSFEDCNGNGVPDEVETAQAPHAEVLLRHAPTGQLLASDADFGSTGQSIAEDFALGVAKRIESIKIWGAYFPGEEASINDFTVVFHEAFNGRPGPTVATEHQVPATIVSTGVDLPFFLGVDRREISLTLQQPVTLPAGFYFVEIYNDTSGNASSFTWESSEFLGIPGHAYALSTPGIVWNFGSTYDMSIEIYGGIVGGDCNANTVPDDCESDCDGNGRPDECDIVGCSPGDASCADCNANGLLDGCELIDCNENDVPDDCDVASGASDDCNDDSVPDECGADCNSNGIADECDFLAGTLNDNNGNGIADECETIFVDSTAAGAADGMSWNTAFGSLQEALTAAADSDGIVQELWVVAGTYRPGPPGSSRNATLRIPDGIAVYGGFSGAETFEGQRDPVANVTILSGDLLGNDGPDFAFYGDNAYHVVTISGTDGPHVSTVLDGFVIKGGNANGIPPNFLGAGVYVDGGQPTISRCTLTENLGFAAAGMRATNASPRLENCTFIGNKAEAAGGLSTAGNSAPVLTDCLFVENDGGGMQNTDGSAATLLRTEFRANTSNSSGAGLHNANNADANLTECTFADNVSVFGDGGGVYSTNGSDVVAVHCTFRNNQAFTRGGGMYNFSNNAAIVNCAFVGNHVTDLFSTGGGLYVSAGSPTITNSTFHDNSAAGSGGGIYHIGSGSTITLSNTIAWGNTAGGSSSEGAQVFIATGTLDVDYSCIQGLTGGLGGAGNIGDDPRFVDAVAGDLRLQLNSPCCDAGDNLADTDSQSAGHQALPGSDLDGNFRFYDNVDVLDSGNGLAPIVDMGAWEFQQCTAPTVTVAPADRGGCLGGSATFEVTAVGTQPLTYQWRRNGLSLPGATARVHTVAPIGPADAGQYDVTISNGCGSIASSPAVLSIETTVPSVTTHPQSQGGCLGQSVTLTVQGESAGPVAYQWRKNLSVIPGATNSTFIIEAFGIDDEGTYDALVSNGCGSIASDPAVVRIGAAPTVTVHPSDSSTCEGGVAILSLAHSGTDPISYQWRKDGIIIDGAAEATLVIEGVGPADAGAYDVIVSNPCGSDTSDAATLIVEPVVIGDHDGDCDVDIDDYRVFHFECVTVDHTAPGFEPPEDHCLRFDFDGDGDVDALDFGNLQASFSG